MREGKIKEMTQVKEHVHEEGPVLVWVNCPYEEVTLLAREALGEKAHIHSGNEPPEGETPSTVLLCSNGEGIDSRIRRVHALAPGAPVLVFGQREEPRLAKEALRAGACGFVHAGMRPEQIALALLLASEGEILIPKNLLGELLGQRLFTRRPKLLDP
jgi:DNA-binding NarL/FixJ family response regulator